MLTDAVNNVTAAEEDENLGWKVPKAKKKRSPKAETTPPVVEQEIYEDDNFTDEDLDGEVEPTARHRARLLKELSARIARDTQLGYAMREFEMQRALMGKGARKKLAAPEQLGGDDEGEDEDDFDKPRKKRSASKITPVDPSTYKPRVYKWKPERKK
jgi:U3 small nucleolar RNA-associated protein 11